MFIMGGMHMTFAEFVNYLNGIAWGPQMLVLLVGTGVYLSIRLGFVCQYIRNDVLSFCICASVSFQR